MQGCFPNGKSMLHYITECKEDFTMEHTTLPHQHGQSKEQLLCLPQKILNLYLPFSNS